jgi:hypothetical protein
MNNIERRLIYGIGIYLYFMSYGKPLSPSKIEEFLFKLLEKKQLKFIDKDQNRYILNLVSEQEINTEDFDYAFFLSYLEEVNIHLKNDLLSAVLDLMTHGSELNITISNNVEIKIIEGNNKDVFNHTINFVDRDTLSITIGKKDLFVDGGFEKNVKLLNAVFGKINLPISIYRDYREIQDKSNYYDSVKYLYDYYVEEYRSKLDDESYVNKLWKNLLHLSMDVISGDSSHILKKDQKPVYLDKASALSLGLYIETTDDRTPIIKIKSKFCEHDIFKIRTKKEKYKDGFRYKSYIEVGNGFKLFTLEGK